MKTNISIDLSDEERNRLYNICFNSNGKKMISRKELTNLVDIFVEQLLEGETPREVTSNIARDGMKYYFNDVQVTAEEYERGIQSWLEKRKGLRLC